MQYIKGMQSYQNDNGTAITLGKFDGLHRGHETLIERVIAHQNEDGVDSVVFAFDMGPLYETLGKKKENLITNEERVKRLDGRVDYLVECPFVESVSKMEAEIFIKEGAIFLTLEVANQQYVQTGGKIRGLLVGRTSLEEWGQYQANDGNWYLNIGGARSWNRENGNPDGNLKQITFLQHEKDLMKKQDKEDNTLPTRAKTITGAIKEIFDELWKKATTGALGRVKIGSTLSVASDGTLDHRTDGGYKHIPSGGAAGQILKYLSPHTAAWSSPATLKFKSGNRELGTYNVTGSNLELGLSPSDLGVLPTGSLPAGIPDAKGIYDLLEKGYGGQLDENLLYLNDRGVKQEGYLYFDKNKPGLFRCIKTTTADYVTNSTEYFVDASPASNSDRLANLIAYDYLYENYTGTNDFNLKKPIDNNKYWLYIIEFGSNHYPDITKTTVLEKINIGDNILTYNFDGFLLTSEAFSIKFTSNTTFQILKGEKRSDMLTKIIAFKKY